MEVHSADSLVSARHHSEFVVACIRAELECSDKVIDYIPYDSTDMDVVVCRLAGVTGKVVNSNCCCESFVLCKLNRPCLAAQQFPFVKLVAPQRPYRNIDSDYIQHIQRMLS